LVEHCFREAGAGGSNPLTPTNVSAIFPADLGVAIVPEMTEHGTNRHHLLAPGWHWCSHAVRPDAVSAPAPLSILASAREGSAGLAGGDGPGAIGPTPLDPFHFWQPSRAVIR